jgi:hypothetical protein
VRLLTLPFRLVVVLLKLLVLIVAVVGMPYVAIPTVALLFLGRRKRERDIERALEGQRLADSMNEEPE